MGKVGRFACIFTPMACTLASLICIVLVGLGGTMKSSTTLNNFYFFKADTTNFNANGQIDIIPGTVIDNIALGQNIQAAVDKGDIKDFYTVSLWNYCSGSKVGDSWQVDTCGKPKAGFWFNPIQVWGLENTDIEKEFPQKLQQGLNAYQKAAKWMFIFYLCAAIATLATLVLGIFAICSRWGSFVTTIVANVAGVFIFAASVLATAIYVALAGAFNTALHNFGIKGSLGYSMLVTTWLAVALAWVAGIFWLFSTCCVSGRSSNKRTKAEKTPYTYERVASPYVGGPGDQRQSQSMPMQDNPKHTNAAYEPYRHV